MLKSLFGCLLPLFFFPLSRWSHTASIMLRSRPTHDWECSQLDSFQMIMHDRTTSDWTNRNVHQFWQAPWPSHHHVLLDIHHTAWWWFQHKIFQTWIHNHEDFQSSSYVILHNSTFFDGSTLNYIKIKKVEWIDSPCKTVGKWFNRLNFVQFKTVGFVS